MTADREQLTDLLERVEGATGADREIDAAMACLLDGFWPQLTAYRNRDGTTFRMDFCRKDPDGALLSPGLGGLQMVRAYTASLDSALALLGRVLPGCLWRAGSGVPGITEPWFRIGESPAFDGHAPTLPLSILSAMLRALIARAAS